MMAVYRFSNSDSCADLEVSDQDYRQIKTAMEMRGFSMTEKSPGLPTKRRLSADEIGALFHMSSIDEVRGPGADGRSERMGVVAGDIRIRGGIAVSF